MEQKNSCTLFLGKKKFNIEYFLSDEQKKGSCNNFFAARGHEFSQKKFLRENFVSFFSFSCFCFSIYIFIMFACIYIYIFFIFLYIYIYMYMLLGLYAVLHTTYTITMTVLRIFQARWKKGYINIFKNPLWIYILIMKK